jgi:hypothetical protein
MHDAHQRDRRHASLATPHPHTRLVLATLRLPIHAAPRMLHRPPPRSHTLRLTPGQRNNPARPDALIHATTPCRSRLPLAHPLPDAPPHSDVTHTRTRAPHAGTPTDTRSCHTRQTHDTPHAHDVWRSSGRRVRAGPGRSRHAAHDAARRTRSPRAHRQRITTRPDTRGRWRRRIGTRAPADTPTPAAAMAARRHTRRANTCTTHTHATAATHPSPRHTHTPDLSSPRFDSPSTPHLACSTALRHDPHTLRVHPGQRNNPARPDSLIRATTPCRSRLPLAHPLPDAPPHSDDTHTRTRTPHAATPTDTRSCHTRQTHDTPHAHDVWRGSGRRVRAGPGRSRHAAHDAAHAAHAHTDNASRHARTRGVDGDAASARAPPRRPRRRPWQPADTHDTPTHARRTPTRPPPPIPRHHTHTTDLSSPRFDFPSTPHHACSTALRHDPHTLRLTPCERTNPARPDSLIRATTPCHSRMPLAHPLPDAPPHSDDAHTHTHTARGNTDRHSIMPHPTHDTPHAHAVWRGSSRRVRTGPGRSRHAAHDAARRTRSPRTLTTHHDTPGHAGSMAMPHRHARQPTRRPRRRQWQPADTHDTPTHARRTPTRQPPRIPRHHTHTPDLSSRHASTPHPRPTTRAPPPSATTPTRSD